MAKFLVECRPDARRGLIPARFGWSGHMQEIAEVLDAWEGEDHRYFRVQTRDRAVYVLRHDRRGDRWQIHFFRACNDAG